MTNFEYDILAYIYQNPRCTWVEVVNKFASKSDVVKAESVLQLFLERELICKTAQFETPPSCSIKHTALGVQQLLHYDEQHKREAETLAREEKIRAESRKWERQQAIITAVISLVSAVVGAILGAFI